MKEPCKLVYQLGFFALFQSAWCFLFYKFYELAGNLIEAYSLKTEHPGEFYPLLYKQFDWQLGWILIYGSPVISLCCFMYFLWKSKPEWSWISLLSVQLLGALLAMVLVLLSIVDLSWRLW